MQGSLPNRRVGLPAKHTRKIKRNQRWDYHDAERRIKAVEQV